MKKIDILTAQHDQYAFKADIEKKKLKDDYNDLLRKYKEAIKHNHTLEKTLDFAQAIDIKTINAVDILPKLKSNKSESTAVMVGSDWHAYETVDRNTVNGKNEYNPIIAEKRIHEFFKGGLRWVDIHRSGTQIDTLVLGLLGDLMNGFIHEEFAEDNAGTPLEELRFLLTQLKSGINFLLDNGKFKKIVIVCTGGNHGRTTLKIRIATRNKHSYEYFLFHILAELFKDEKRLEFVIGDGYHIYQDIYSWKFRYHHGDAIRYGGGVGGITIPVNKSISQWNKSELVDYDIFGHYHTFLWGGNFIANGSLIGYNAFAIKIKAAFEKPKQTFILVNKKRGVTAVHPIYVEGK